MKKLKYLISTIILVVSTMSCQKLDLAPEDYYGSTNFWNNEAQVKGFINGIHTQIRSANVTFWLMGEARGGLQKTGTSSTSVSIDYSSPIKDQGFTKDKPGITNWGGFYNTRILNVNLAIQKVEKECTFLSTESRSFYLGQLYGIRAFYYFWLYRTYGGVPIVTDTKVLDGVTSAEPLYTERSTPKQTFDFIKADIAKSEQSFGSNVSTPESKSVWSKYATYMLKAEVYLWSAKVTTGDQSPATGDLGVAEAALLQVKDKFSLLPKFSDVFSSSPLSNKGNNEIIFAMRFLDNEATNNASQFLYSDNTFIGAKYDANKKKMGDTLNLRGNGLLRNEYTWAFFQSFDGLDTRRNATFLDYYNLKNNALVDGGTVLRKFLGIINSTNNRVYIDDIPVYRYADVLLMLAEVENKKGGDPSPYINEIRKRAYGTNYNATVHGYVNADFATNELAILNERDKEFVFENKRWFDIVRMQDASGKSLAFSASANYGTAVPIINPAEAHKLLWPVDVTVLNNDPKVKQTPGY